MIVVLLKDLTDHRPTSKTNPHDTLQDSAPQQISLSPTMTQEKATFLLSDEQDNAKQKQPFKNSNHKTHYISLTW